MEVALKGDPLLSINQLGLVNQRAFNVRIINVDFTLSSI